ncbi:hypothetical protein BGZ79_003057, partial [Entomortierella chlamydospora]
MAQGQASSQSFTVEELDITWIRSAVDRSPNAFFNAFSLCNKMLALQRYTWMVKNSDLDEDTEKTLLSRTAAALVEGSETYADQYIHGNATQTRNTMANSKNISISSSPSSNTNGEHQLLTLTEHIPNSSRNNSVIDKHQASTIF